MARIRTIKPEFPQSETTGRLSRDARLLFIQLWTIVDDEGRARGSSRMLASLLYPYDDDAPALMQGWLDELQEAGCIRQYEDSGSRYLEIINWLKHQKIDKPSKSRLPAFVEFPRVFANILEASSTDLGPRTSTKDHGSDTSLRSDVDGGSKRYAFESGVIRLSKKDFDGWTLAFANLDLRAELLSLTPWANEQPPDKWFFAVSSALAKRNREQKVKLEQAKTKGYSPAIPGII